MRSGVSDPRHGLELTGNKCDPEELKAVADALSDALHVVRWGWARGALQRSHLHSGRVLLSLAGGTLLQVPVQRKPRKTESAPLTAEWGWPAALRDGVTELERCLRDQG